MLVSIRDCRHSKKDRQWIQDVYAEYLDAFADLNTGLFPVLGAGNPHEDEIFANWFANDQSHPLRDPQRTGARGLRTGHAARDSRSGERSRRELPHVGILRAQAATGAPGIGRDAATLIFDRFAGDWEIVEYQRNPGAVAFWRRVLSEYCAGQYTERRARRRSAPALQQPRRRRAPITLGQVRRGPSEQIVLQRSTRAT